MNECFVSSGISGKRKERIRRDVITYSIERGLGADEVRRSALKYGKKLLKRRGAPPSRVAFFRISAIR